MKILEIPCHSCGKIRIYKSLDAYNLSLKKKSSCINCAVKRNAKRHSEMSNLLKENCLAYYWAGFILADGHIENNVRLSVTLGLKDQDHLIKLKEFLHIKDIKKSKISVCISAMDINIISKFSEKFDIHSNKTLFPPKNIKNILNRKLLISLIAGFIDGDGSIRNLHNRPDFNLRIKCHKSWYVILEYFSHIIAKNNFCRINNQGYASLVISNTQFLKDLKKELLPLNLPLLSRKWDKINLNYKSRRELEKERVLIIKKYLNTNISQKEICKILNMSPSGVSSLMKKNNLKTIKKCIT